MIPIRTPDAPPRDRAVAMDRFDSASARHLTALPGDTGRACSIVLILLLNGCGEAKPTGPTNEVPLAPSAVSAGVSGRSIYINWTHDGRSVEGFELERTIPGGDWAILARLGGSESTFRDRYPVHHQPYRYRVRAFNRNGNSPPSLEATAVVDQLFAVFPVSTFGRFHSCGLTAAGAAYCWGNNWSGSLGDGSHHDRNRPVPVSTTLTFSAISAEGQHTCGIGHDSRTYCWGRNDYGQLGDGTDGNGSVMRVRGTPAPVKTSVIFKKVFTGGANTCGLASDGTAYCWGMNVQGELGDGSTISRSTPVAVATTLKFEEIALGRSGTCGITTSRELYCWGVRFDLAGGLPVPLVPVPVPTALTFKTIDAGDPLMCGLALDARLYCFEVAVKFVDDDPVSFVNAAPAPVGDTRFSQISLGVTVSCGISLADTALCWGFNSHGQLGDGSDADRDLPGQVAGSITFETVHAGGSHACARTADQLTYCWGSNVYAELGAGSYSDISRTPLPVLTWD